MITRDFILRQIHQMVQALAKVLLHRQSAQHEEAQEVLEVTVQDVTGMDLERLHDLDRNDLLALCGTGGAFSPEKAAALADLLYEDQDVAGRVRSLWLYEAALEAEATLPFDVYDRISALRRSTEA